MTSRRRSARAAFFAVASVLCTLLVASPSSAGDPYLRWYSIETPHYRVTYHGGLDAIAQRTANVLETVRQRLAVPLANDPQEIVHVVLTDGTDSANGSATIVPFDAIRLFVTAPEDLSTLGDFDDWITTLVTHEAGHVHHIDNIPLAGSRPTSMQGENARFYFGFPALLNTIVGKIYAPNQVQPSWIREGVAVAMESLLTSGGRVRSSIFDMYLRADVIEDNFATLDQMSHSVRRWPTGDIPYLYGGKFMGFIVENYGEDVLGAVATDYGVNIVPWGINRSIRRATGRTYLELYDAWHKSLEEAYGAQTSAIRRRGLRVGTRLTHSGYAAASPRWVPPNAREGKGEELLYFRDDSHAPAGLYRLPLVSRTEADESAVSLVARTSGSPRVGSFDRDGGIVFDSVAPSRRRHSFDDLHHLGPHQTSATGRYGTRDRWTTGMRIRAPDVSADGRHVTFITNHAGTMTPRIADILPEGGIANVRRLVATGPWEQSFTPRFSPDGRKIAYSSWASGGFRDIRIVDVRTGAILEATHDRAMDLEPSWSPDGRYVLFSSDRTGVPNIYAYDLRSGVTKQVTNVLFGAFMPEVSPDGRTLAYVGYTSSGFDLFSLPFDERDFLDAPIGDARHPEPRTAPRERQWPVSPYDPWPTIRPHNYSIDYNSATRLGKAFTFGVRGSDIAGIHSFGFSLTRYPDIDDFSGSFSYAYTRLPFDLRMSAFRSIGVQQPLFVGDTKYTVLSDSIGATTGVTYSLPGMFENTGLSLQYVATSVARRYPQGYAIDPFERPQVLPKRQFVGIVRAGVTYNNTSRSNWAISTERGFFASFATQFAGAATGSEGTLNSYDARAAAYVLAPWLRHHVFAVQVSAGTETGSSILVGNCCSTGGYTPLDVSNTVDAFINDLNQSPVVLRGYPPDQFGGTQYNLLNLEYRFPIAFVERGISTLPVFFDSVSGALFLDYGGAFDKLNLEDPLSNYHAGIGGQVHFEFTLGYFLDTGLTLGWARALDRKAIPGADASQTYLIVAGSF